MLSLRLALALVSTVTLQKSASMFEESSWKNKKTYELV
jgi:hypothetical protein